MKSAAPKPCTTNPIACPNPITQAEGCYFDFTCFSYMVKSIHILRERSSISTSDVQTSSDDHEHERQSRAASSFVETCRGLHFLTASNNNHSVLDCATHQSGKRTNLSGLAARFAFASDLPPYEQYDTAVPCLMDHQMARFTP